MSVQLEMFATGTTPYAVRTAPPSVRRQEVHANSRRTYYEEGHNLGKRALQVLGYYKAAGRPMPDRDCMNALGYNDMNSVRPRITELVKAGLLREAGSTIDYKTGKKVRLVEAA